MTSVQSLSLVQPFVTQWTSAHQASLSTTNSQSLPKPMSMELVMPSNHLILCRPLLLLPSIFPSITVFSNESVLRIRWPKYRSDLAGAFAEGLWKPLCFLTARGLSHLLPIIRVTSSHSVPPECRVQDCAVPPQAAAELHCTSNLFSVKCKELQECTAQRSCLHFLLEPGAHSW